MQNKSAGKLFFCKGDDLNGHPELEIDAPVGDNYPAGTEQIFIGGRCDNLFNFEGKINEVAVYNRLLNAEEVIQSSILSDPGTLRSGIV